MNEQDAPVKAPGSCANLVRASMIYLYRTFIGKQDPVTNHVCTPLSFIETVLGSGAQVKYS